MGLLLRLHFQKITFSMVASDRKMHWETIYQNKSFHEMSWYQATPAISLQFISDLRIDKSASIIDIGGGDSHFVDNLLGLGFSDITVLDVSESAIRRAEARLGHLAEKVTWIAEDVTQFKPEKKYELWHDRAAFHFLTDASEIGRYIEILKIAVADNGHVIIGTFSENGPKKCSGIEIKQYSESSMSELFENGFEKLSCETIDHKTPFNTIQNFVFCRFSKRS